MRSEPVPLWSATVDINSHRYRPPVTEDELWKLSEELMECPDFRGVSFDRLETILATGIDVDPPTAPIFVSDFEKAWEYGGWPKVIVALDWRHLDRTFREIPADTPDEEIARLMIDYPTRIPDEAGERIWLTRLAESDPRAASPYEAAYARWIPGDPSDALRAVFVFVPERQRG